MSGIKKAISVLLCILLVCFAAFPYGTFAAQETDAEYYATLLHNIKLFYGDDDGYALDTVATRVESVAMVLRIRGDEPEALSQKFSQPFSDVPSWAENYVGYAYQKKIASGIDDTRFGSDNATTANQYLTFLLRALGYSDQNGDFTWNSAIDFSQKISLVSAEQAKDLQENNFTRDKMVTLSYHALSQPLKNSRATLASVLVDKGVVEEGAVRSVGVRVIFDANSTPEDTAVTVPETPVTEVTLQKTGQVVNTGTKNLLVRSAPGGDQVGSFAPGSILSVSAQKGNCYYVTGTDVTTGTSVSGYCVSDYIVLCADISASTPIEITGTIAEKLQKLRLKFPDGSYWNHVGISNNPDGVTNMPCTHHGTGTCGYYPDNCDCNSYNNAIQCLGFAYKIGNELFGTNVRNWPKFYDYDSLRVGDHVRYVDGSREHSVIVLSKTQEGITAVDCNYDNKCGIRWDAYFSREKIESKLLYYQTGQE